MLPSVRGLERDSFTVIELYMNTVDINNIGHSWDQSSSHVNDKELIDLLHFLSLRRC